ncbi:MAG: hypothetical protein EXS37_11025 [Opitutus sp.]|nr:hypothetical protein [Opitutus sp.]
MLPRPTSTADLRFFDPRAVIDQGTNRLPHWRQTGVACFVTFRLADSVPQELLHTWATERRSWLSRNPPPHTVEQDREHDELFTAKIDDWLDQGTGSCALRDPTTRQALIDTLIHFEGSRYECHAWIVMPNHVHLLFSPLAEHTVESLVRSWKGISARRANQIHRRSGAFWMKDYFDRLIRDADHFWRCVRYIRRNPEKAKLPAGDYALYAALFVRDHLNAEAGSQRIGGTPAAGSSEEQGRRQECRRSV